MANLGGGGIVNLNEFADNSDPKCESPKTGSICEQIFPCSEKVADEHPNQQTDYRCGQKAELNCKGRAKLNKALAQSVQGPSLFLSEDSDTSENIGLASSCFSDILNFSYSRDIVGFGGLETLELSNNLTRSRSVCEIESVSRIKPIFKTVNSKVTHNSPSEKQRHLLYDLNCLNNLNDYSKEDIKLDYVKTRILVDTKGENLKEKDDKEDENRILNDIETIFQTQCLF